MEKKKKNPQEGTFQSNSLKKPIQGLDDANNSTYAFHRVGNLVGRTCNQVAFGHSLQIDQACQISDCSHEPKVSSGRGQDETDFQK